EPWELWRHGSGVDVMGREPAHPQSVGYNDSVHAERADGSDVALPEQVHPRRRRRGGEAGVEGEPARAAADSRPRAQGRERIAELVHPADGHLSHAPRSCGRRATERISRTSNSVSRHTSAASTHSTSRTAIWPIHCTLGETSVA